MAIIKCKMCGGDLLLMEDSSVAECEYCGSRQTVPLADNEKKLMLFARANRLRAACEFDKAAGIYEAIVAEFPQEAEAYWGLVLCKYGIEYVDDPATGKKIPTCHRSSFDSVLEDNNFDQAMENADEVALGIYHQEAKQIEGIRRGILEVSSSERAYDMFICYKETDSAGNRSVDSLLAQDIYDALTARGYRVFFSRISLEDKLGQAYEPYIFAALNSAKIMLVVGTCYEHFNAVWVKNEWSRYLKIVASDKNKYLIPCYKGLEPSEDLPREFAHLQGQDMGKVGAIADLLRGVEKLMPNAPAVWENGSASENPKIASLRDRGSMALEDGNWAAADRFFEEILNHDARNAPAYLGKLLAEYKIAKADELGTCRSDFTSSYNYQKAQQFGDDGVRKILDNACKDKIYYAVKKLLDENPAGGKLSVYREAAAQLAAISGWRDADKLSEMCQSRILEIETARKQKKTRQDAEKGKQKSKMLVPAAALVLIVIAGLLWMLRIQPEIQTRKEASLQEAQRNAAIALQEEQYSAAVSLMEEGLYDEAMDAFTKLDGYRDSDVQIENCRIAKENAILEEQYQQAEALAAEGKYAHAGIAFAKLDGYKDARDRSFEAWSNTRRRTTIAHGWDYKEHFWIGLKNDGTVITAGSNKYGQREVDNWTDIVEVGTLLFASVGLKEDGTLIVAGETDSQEDMDIVEELCQWTDIVSILSANNRRIYGLKKDGTVVTAGYAHFDHSDLTGWTDVVAMQRTGTGIIGLCSDGKVIGQGLPGSDGSQSIENWDNVMSLDYYNAGFYTLGQLITGTCTDGTVSVQFNDYLSWDDQELEYCGKIDQWTDITETCGPLGLHADGTVSVFPEDAKYVSGPDGINTTSLWADAVKDWNGITALRGDGRVIYGLKADGTVVTAGNHWNGSDNVSSWTDIMDIVQEEYTIGIRKDGSLVVAEYVNSELESWTDIRLP